MPSLVSTTQERKDIIMIGIDTDAAVGSTTAAATTNPVW